MLVHGFCCIESANFSHFSSYAYTAYMTKPDMSKWEVVDGNGSYI